MQTLYDAYAANGIWKSISNFSFCHNVCNFIFNNRNFSNRVPYILLIVFKIVCCIFAACGKGLIRKHRVNHERKYMQIDMTCAFQTRRIKIPYLHVHAVKIQDCDVRQFAEVSIFNLRYVVKYADNQYYLEKLFLLYVSKT